VIDPDDVTAFQLEGAMRELRDACNRLADPNQGWWSWFELTLSVLIHGQCAGRPLEWVMLLTARRATSEIRSSL